MYIRNRQFIPNGYYHIFNRGHNKQPIFLTHKDYQRYLKRLAEYKLKHTVTILAYCLMPNHIHLLLRQDSNESIDKFIHRLHTAYTMFFNIKYERLGAVFQSRFKSKLIETDEYLIHISRYIHLNPLGILRAQGQALNSQLSGYRWSSYHEYIGNPSLRICRTDIILNYFSDKSAALKKKKYLQFINDWVKNADETFLEKMNKGEVPEIL